MDTPQQGQFHSFANSSWTDILPFHKSTNSSDVFFNNAVVSWKIKLYSSIGASSTESELISAVYCVTEVVFLSKVV
jgi:hypothetical protein